VWLHDGEKMLKISLFVLTQLTNVTDTWTHKHRMTAKPVLDASIARQKSAGVGDCMKMLINLLKSCIT